MYVVNPHIWGKVGSRNYVKLYLGPINWKFKIDILLVDAKLFDVDFMFANKGDAGGVLGPDLDWCFGIQYVLNLLTAWTKMEVNTYICQYPMFGRAIGDNDDCLWMWYPISAKLFYLKNILKDLKYLDIKGDIFEWMCDGDWNAHLIDYDDADQED